MIMASLRNHIFRLLGISAIVGAAALMNSCSTTRVLGDGEFRLAKNKIEVTNSKDFNTKEIEQYLKQQPKGFSPLLYVYNWSGKDTSKGINRFIRKMGIAPLVYESDLVSSSVENIKNHLEYIGYYNSEVKSEVELKNKNVTVNYEVTLGKQFPISKISYVVPNGDFYQDFMDDTVNVSVKEGTYLSESVLEAESVRSSSAMRAKGYYGFTKNYYFFEADTLSHRDSALLVMTVNEYTRNENPEDAKPIRKYYIGDVTISHPSTIKFKESVLKGMNTLVPGQLYTEADINNTYSRLASLKAFNGVNVGLSASDSTTVNCDITLTQSKLQAIKTGFEVSTNSSGLIGMSPQLTYTHKNIFHGGEWLNLSFMGNFQFKLNDDTRSNEFGVSTGLSFPKFLGLSYDRFKKKSVPRTEINASYNFQHRPEYMRNIASFSFGYSGNFKQNFYYQYYPIQANIVGLRNMDEDFYNTLSNNPFLRYAYQSHFDQGMGLTLYYTTNADVIPLTPYHYYRLQMDVSGNELSVFNGLMKTNSDGRKEIFGIPYSQYVRAEVQVGKTMRFGKNDSHAIATRFLAGAGYAYGNSSALPFEKQFYSGGANGLRGWQVRSVGPGNAELNKSFSIPSQTGDMKLEANIEYRFKMFWKLEGATFVDAGNVWTIQDRNAKHDPQDKSNFTLKNLPETIAADWGLGVRVNLTFILLRFDLGQKIHDPSLVGNKWISPDKWLSKNTFALHFGVGYPF